MSDNMPGDPPKTDSEYQREAEAWCKATVYCLREPDETTGKQASLEDDALTLLNSFEPSLASLLRALDDVADLTHAMELFKETRRVQGMTWSEAAKQVIEERNQLRDENDALKAELASLRTVAKAAQMQLKMPYQCVALVDALSDHAAKYKLE